MRWPNFAPAVRGRVAPAHYGEARAIADARAGVDAAPRARGREHERLAGAARRGAVEEATGTRGLARVTQRVGSRRTDGYRTSVALVRCSSTGCSPAAPAGDAAAVEDTDTERNQPELTDEILRSIEWLVWLGRRTRSTSPSSELVTSRPPRCPRRGGHAVWSGWQPAQAKARRAPATDRDAGLGRERGGRCGSAPRRRRHDIHRPDPRRGSATTTTSRTSCSFGANGTPMFLLATPSTTTPWDHPRA